MALNDHQRKLIAGVIAAHPKPLHDGSLVKCSGRFCNWEERREEGYSAIYMHADHVTKAIEKVVFP